MSDTFLTREEVREFTDCCHKQKQIEALRTMGVPFWVNPAGRPVVARSAIEGRGAGKAVVVKAPWVPPGMRS